MTKKHFLAIADGLIRSRPLSVGITITAQRFYLERVAQWERDMYVIADVLAAQNYKFDTVRWLAYIAAGVNSR